MIGFVSPTDLLWNMGLDFVDEDERWLNEGRAGRLPADVICLAPC